MMGAMVAAMPAETIAPVLRIGEVTKQYPLRHGPPVWALRGVSLELTEGSTLGVVGESGCGKSTLARLIVGVEEPSSGSVELMGEPVGATPRSVLARRVQLVFQDPFSSLNPRLTVEAALGEVLAVHALAPAGPGREARRARATRVEELLGIVALAPRFADRYPHELSGGQAQRVAIARALAVEPRLLVLDEPTSALDVSVRAEVMNLLIRLQDELSLSYVFISHDLAMVRHISEVIAVMYLGRVVEHGPYEEVLGAPLHPYTAPSPRPCHCPTRRTKRCGAAESSPERLPPSAPSRHRAAPTTRAARSPRRSAATSCRRSWSSPPLTRLPAMSPPASRPACSPSSARPESAAPDQPARHGATGGHSRRLATLRCHRRAGGPHEAHP